MALMFPIVHPYGAPEKGTLESIEAMTRDDLLRIDHRSFSPAVTSVVVVGDVPHWRRLTSVAGPYSEKHEILNSEF
jgi:predicted Zn-dependent peptidase